MKTRTMIGKRVLALWLSIAMILCNIPECKVFAYSTGTDENGWKYETTSSGTAIITGYTGTESELVVPSEVVGYPVTSIGRSAFSGSTSLTSVSIPESVTVIGVYAFKDCKVLKSVTFSEGLMTISEGAFSGASSLKSLELPSTVTTIGQSAFENCTSLISMNLQEGISSISRYAFRGCTSLEEIRIPSSLNVLPEYVFSGCVSLTSIELPETLTTIGQRAFDGCKSLKSIKIPNNVSSLGIGAFSYCSGLEEVVLSTGLTKITEDAFRECSTLKVIEIPGSVISIDTYAFNKCTNLETVILSDGLQTIGSSAFSGCTKLMTIVFPATLKTIGTYAFSTCTSLAKIAIPNSVITIDEGAFYECTGLMSVILSEGLERVGKQAFRSCSIEEVVIPEGVNTIESRAFYDCKSLTDVVIPKTVTTLPEYVFEFCSSLQSVRIPNSVTSIGGGNFKYSNSIVIYCEENSETYKYAVSNNYKYAYYCTVIPGETTALTTPVKSGYEFQGWFTEKKAGTKVTDVSAITEETILYSQWKKILTDANTTIDVDAWNLTYSEKAYEPEITVKDGSTLLSKDLDYTVTYKNNINAGTATVEVSGIGDYTGTVSTTFTIQQEYISSTSVEIEAGDKIYTGTEITPIVTVTSKKGTVLKLGTDYSIKYADNVNAGWATITITGLGNYKNSISESFIIDAKNVADATVTLSQNEFIYDGTAKTPSVTVAFGETTLIENIDYTLTYTNQYSAGTAVVTIAGMGNYTGSRSEQYKIIQLNNIASADIVLSQTEFIYDGTEKMPEITLTFEGKTLVENVDYRVVVANNTEIGTATVTISGMGSWNGSVERTFSIEKESIVNATVTLSATEVIYNGTEQKPEVIVKLGEKPLVAEIDYTVSYESNVNAGVATVLITGIGSYRGELELEFEILPLSIETAEVTLEIQEYIYSGSENTTNVVVKLGEAFLVADRDYKVTYSNNINVGTATVTIEGVGNYTGTVTKEYTILPYSIENAIVTVAPSEFIYDGTEKTPDASVQIGAEEKETEIPDASAGEIPDIPYDEIVPPLEKDTTPPTIRLEQVDEISYIAYLEDDRGLYAFMLPLGETIKLGNVLTAEVPFTVTMTGVWDVIVYDKYGNEASAEVTLLGPGFTEEELEELERNENADKEASTIDLEIETDTSNSNDTSDTTVTVNGITLVKDVDYTVAYSENVNAGTATVTVTGIGNYTGVVTKTFVINPVEITDVTLSETVYDYNGKEKLPEVTVKFGEKTLVTGTDYTVVYNNNINAGIATVSVTGIGNFTGVVEKTFNIQPLKITDVTLSKTAYTYDGVAKKTTVTVKCVDTKLKNGTDYKVTYSNNVNPGTAKVTVTGIGNYTGSITKTFKINLKKVTSLKQKTTYSTSKITMTWNKVTGASGYAVYRSTSKNGTYKLLKTYSSNTCTNAGLKAGSKYYYKVRAYATVNGKKVYGDYSDAKSMLTKPGAPTGFTVTLKSRTAKISWSKSTGAVGYEVYMAGSRNGAYTKIKSVGATTTAYNKTGLVKGQNYYFKMRAYVKTGTGAKVYSGYSKIKAVQVK